MMDFDLLLDIKSMIYEENDDVYFCVDWAVRCATTSFDHAIQGVPT